jgi:hypothetical protein
MTPIMTRNYLVTTLHDITDEPCDDLEDLVQITVKYIELLMIGIAGDYVTKRMTR